MLVSFVLYLVVDFMLYVFSPACFQLLFNFHFHFPVYYIEEKKANIPIIGLNINAVVKPTASINYESAGAFKPINIWMEIS
jgi:hypothetical protein